MYLRVGVWVWVCMCVGNQVLRVRQTARLFNSDHSKNNFVNIRKKKSIAVVQKEDMHTWIFKERKREREKERKREGETERRRDRDRERKREGKMEKEREARRKMIPNRFTVASLLGSSCLSFFLFFWNYYDYFLSFLLIAKEEPQNEEIKTHPDSHGIIRIIHRLATVTITSGPARHHNLKKAHAPSPSSGRDKLPIKLTLRYNNKQKPNKTKNVFNKTTIKYHYVLL